MRAADLLAAELIAVGCPRDGLWHLLDDQAHAEALAECAEGWVDEPRFVALCGREFAPDSLTADARPFCRACVREAAPRLRAAREGVSRCPMSADRSARQAWQRWTRALAVVGTVLAWLRDGGEHAEVARHAMPPQHVSASGTEARRSTGPGGLHDG